MFFFSFFKASILSSDLVFTRVFLLLLVLLYKPRQTHMYMSLSICLSYLFTHSDLLILFIYF
ncbi:hypothetical protein F4703DRAFT_1848125 [Phycomyces blakesleeanus]